MTDFKELLKFHVKRAPNCSTPEQFKEWRSFAQQQVPSFTTWFCTDCTPVFQLQHKKQGICDHPYIKFKKIEGSMDGYVPSDWSEEHRKTIKRLSINYEETENKITEGTEYEGMKYCAYCQTYQTLPQGKWIRKNNKNGQRWKCQPCIESENVKR